MRIPPTRPDAAHPVDLDSNSRPVSFADPEEDGPVSRAADRIRETKHRFGLEPKLGAMIVASTNVVIRQRLPHEFETCFGIGRCIPGTRRTVRGTQRSMESQRLFMSDVPSSFCAGLAPCSRHAEIAGARPIRW